MARQARLAKDEVRFGMVFVFVVEKNTDLLAGDPRRKFKGRVVFQGNNVILQSGGLLEVVGGAVRGALLCRTVDVFGILRACSVTLHPRDPRARASCHSVTRDT